MQKNTPLKPDDFPIETESEETAQDIPQRPLVSLGLATGWIRWLRQVP